MPQPGPQTLAYHSTADELFYGGAAGGGKTDLLLGLAATQHILSIIWRREYPQLESLVDRSRAVLEQVGRLRESPNPTWTLHYKYYRKLELRAMQRPDDAKKFQGRPHDLKAYDEICHFTLFQFLFTKAWNRSVYPGQRCRVVCAGNPPTDADGRWVVEYWAPWLSDRYPNPAQSGEVRWFITADSKSIEVGGPGKFRFKGDVYESRSRTFIPSRLADNWYLADTGYSATVSALPEPLRSQLLHGDFTAGVTDDPWQLFPTEWVKLAQERWRNHSPMPLSFVDEVGVDVARGGEDSTVFSPRFKNYFFEQELHRGLTTDNGMKVAALVNTSFPASARVKVDSIGVGASALDWLKVKRRGVVAMVASNKSDATDKTGLLGFANKRAEWHWKFREMLDPEGDSNVAIPDDPMLFQELVSIRWSPTIRGVKVEDKDDIKKRLGRSPDRSDALIYASAQETKSGAALFDYMKEQAQDQQKDVLDQQMNEILKNRKVQPRRR